jgi:hypothetical protein
LIQGVDNVRRLLKLSSQSSPGHAQTFIAKRLFGMPESAAKRFRDDDSGYAATPAPGSKVASKNRICYRDRRLLSNMLQGPELAVLIERFCFAFNMRMATLPVGEEWEELPDLFDFLTTHVTPAAIEALCGPALTNGIDPDFVKDFWYFDSWVPAIAKGAPSWLIPQAYRVRNKLLDSLSRWRLQYSQADRGRPASASASMVAKMDLLEVEGWSVQAVAASDLGVIWA